MQILPIICLIWAVVNAQDDDLSKAIETVLGGGKTDDQFKNLIEVTSPKQDGFGALDKCGDGADEGVHICVPYHQCDGVTKMVIQDSRVTGFGKIDIRFGANECEHFLDVCCGVPSGGIREPEVVVPVDPSGTPVEPPSPVTAPVTPISPPVTPISPPVTPISPPETSEPPTPITPRPSSVYCGIRNANGIDFKITGNKDNEAEYGEFPWMVAVLKTNFDPVRDKTLAICGGSLIAPDVVLTGAHCVADLQVSQYKIRAGEWDTQTDKERLPYQERGVRQAIIHESFTPKIIYNNIALLILSTPFTPADNIGTICLPNQNEIITSRNCLASGWGKDVFGKEGKYQVILKKVELPMVPFDACQQALRTTRLGPLFRLHSSFTCAGGEQGKDTCTGDGGSPLICPDPNNPGRYVQAGIVSWGIGCGEKNIPGVYADVAKFRTWIDNKLSRLNINTDPYKV